jgi:uncharacterized protein with FMN-binding domain
MPPPRFDRGTRRIALCGLTTLSAVVLLFSYRTSTSPDGPAGASGTPDGVSPAVEPAAGAAAAAVPYGGTSDAGTTEGPDAGTTEDPDAGTTEGPTAAVAPSTTTRAPRPGKAPSGGGWSGTVTGPVVQVKWGQVQVRATIAQGRITAVDVLRSPDENAHDREINARAVPELVQQTLAAQSARIDMVSGATFTSTGYVQSLQAALDRAGTA